MGIEKSKARTRVCVYWPNMYSDIENTVKQCVLCNTYANTNHKEPLLPHPVPQNPWEKVGIDYFTLNGKDFLLIVDYYSKYPEVAQMTSKTAQATIAKLKMVFARHGIPRVVISQHSSPRSYNIQTSEGTIRRRNRHHLRQTKEAFLPCADNDDYFDDEFDINISPPQLPNEPPQQAETLQPGERRSRYGHVIRPPLRYRN